jgi:endoglucanase
MISIVGASHASPPSNASGQSLYGSPNTSSALNSAGAFAIASKVYGILGKKEYSEQLKKAAEKAWNWAEKNPGVLFYNNDAASGTGGLAAGQQEEDDYSRKINKLEASVYLFDATGDVKYREYFDLNFEESHLFTSQDVSPWEGAFQDVYLYYASLSNCKKSVAEAIQQTYQKGMSRNFVSYEDQRDPYMAHLDVYTWGSNSIKSIMANNFLNIIYYGLNPSKDKAALTAAEGYVHYLHGVNPLGIVYLSNMYAYGGDKCVNEFYHSWFCNESPDWDRVGVSTYGPPPGFLTGGPNPSYQADDCCPFNCGNQSAERACTSETLKPPMGQPAQKSYKDFNTAWPINSWSVTENSCGYQVNYIRMLSKFVKTINR